jgi:hypothetical protein
MKATKTPNKNDCTKIGLGRILPRLDSTSDAPGKLIFLVLYILGAILIWNTQADIALRRLSISLPLQSSQPRIYLSLI